MSLNPNYVIAPSLEMYFVDKTTGFPLADGQVFFYSDLNRSVPKTVYTISGSPPNYSYVALPNPITLSSVGTIQDEDGNNVIPYYYPYDSNGNVELYYIEVFDSNGNPQFTREAWPNIIASSSDEQAMNVINYIPNGQFLLHNNLPADTLNNIPAGQIRQSVTNVAEGGWRFERPSASTATDNVTFFDYSSYVNPPTSSPRYAIQVICSGSNPSDAYKYLSIRFSDVNKFASSTDRYTFGFYASTFNSGNFTVGLNLVKNFGTGGSPSPSTTTQLTTFNITNTLTLFQFSFSFGDNIGKSIGTNNDDYVELAIAFPVNITFGSQLTDFMLLGGQVIISEFPAQTNLDMITRTQVPNVPSYNGYDLYLPRVATPYGEIYDDSQIGMVSAFASSVLPISHLTCDAQTSYYVNSYSSDGIPYKRLWNKLTNWNPSSSNYGLAAFGTGPQYITCAPGQATIGPTDNWAMFYTNQLGAQPNTNAGTTLENYITVVEGGSGYGFTAYSHSVNQIWVLNNSAGVVNGAVGPGTSGFIINTTPNPETGERVGFLNVQQIINITINSFPGNGSYFQLSTPTNSYYFWYNLNGTGTDPSPGGIGVEISINTAGFFFSGDYQSTALATAAAINNFQVTSFSIPVSGSVVIPNSYFTFYANSKLYYPWYSLNGAGTDPMVAGGIGIPISYSISDSQQSLTYKVVYALNSQYYCTPDLRGQIIKGNAGTLNSSNYDINAQYRYSLNNPYINNNITPRVGLYQFDMLLGHNHLLNIPKVGGPSAFTVTPGVTGVPSGYFNGINYQYPIIGETGTGQNDVKNVYLNYYIKY